MAIHPARIPGRGARTRAVLLLVAPFAVLFVLIYIVPAIYSIKEAFYAKTGGGLGLGVPRLGFVGFRNFADVLGSGVWWSGMRRVAEFGVVQIPVMLILALVLALVLDMARVRAKNTFRLVIFAPYAVPGVIAGLMWAYIYLPTLSPLPQILHLLPGFGALNLLGRGPVLWSIANASTWEFAGFNMLIITAGLQAIPQELYDAATAEGAGEIALVRHVKIPLVAPALGLTAVFSIIGTLQLFNEPTVFKSVTTSVTSTYTPNMYAYSQAFSASNLNLAAAASLVLAAVGIVLSVAVVGSLARRGLTG